MKSIVERARAQQKFAKSIGETSFPDFRDELCEAVIAFAEALEFYADKKTYSCRPRFPDTKQAEINFDGGKKARAALKKWGIE